MIKIREDINIENYTLILPSVAVGNVGQLSVDLLISNLNLKNIGSIWSSAFLPIVGLNPYNENSNSLCSTADLYLGTTAKIVLLQLRSPCTGVPAEFYEELSQFIYAKKIAKTVILTSSYDYERSNWSSYSLRFLASDQGLENTLQNLGFERHEQKFALTSAQKLLIPGGGFANGLYSHLLAQKLDCIVLFQCCSEGDNISDALKLMKGLNRWLNLLQANVDESLDVQFPPSWNHLFGNPSSLDIY